MILKTFKTRAIEFVDGREVKMIEFGEPVVLALYSQDEGKTLKVMPTEVELPDSEEFSKTSITETSYFFPLVTRLEGHYKGMREYHFGLQGVKIIFQNDLVSLLFDTTKERRNAVLDEMANWDLGYL